MNLDKMVILAYEKNWTKINNFTIQLIDNAGDQTFTDDELNIGLISVDVPPKNVMPLETYLGGKWYFTNGRADLVRPVLTFRDYNGMSLYKKFNTLFELSLYNYSDDCKMTLQVQLDQPNGAPVKFLEMNDVLIENVSQLSFNTTTPNQIAEFSVTLRGHRQQVEKGGTKPGKFNADIFDSSGSIDSTDTEGEAYEEDFTDTEGAAYEEEFEDDGGGQYSPPANYSQEDGSNADGNF